MHRTTRYKSSIMKLTNPDFLNGVPELLVLQLLTRRPMYGYELVRAIEQSTGQVLEFGEGCIYPVLHRLEKDEFLAARRKRSTAAAEWSTAPRLRAQTAGRQHCRLAKHCGGNQSNSAGRA